MLDHEWRVDRAGDRTLVELVVENETTVDRRVRVENCLDARVEPPRENGVSAPGWDDDGYAGVVPANGRLTLGYACAAPPTDPPVAVRDEGRPAADDEARETTAADAVRRLSDHAPPADAVPVDGVAVRDEGATADPAGTTGPDDTSDGVSSGDDPPAPVAAMVDRLDDGAATDGDTAGGVTVATDERPDEGAPAPSEAVAHTADASVTTSTPDPAGGTDDSDADPAGRTDDSDADPAPTETDATPDDRPPAVTSWLADVRGRVEDADALADGDLAAAARVVEERGGVTEAATLDEALAADERALRALATEAERLADRAADAEVPVDALRRLS